MKIIKIFALILNILLASCTIYSQDSKVSYFKHELSIGMGYANGFENHVFNVPSDVSIKSAIGMNLNYCYRINKEIGLGIRMFGYNKKLPEINLISSNGTIEKIKFEMYEFNFDAEFRYIFGKSVIEPYIFLLTGAVFGDVSGSGRKLSISGYNIGAGTGLKFRIGKRWNLSAECIGSFGSASWEIQPFLNSTSDEYNPSMAGVFINLSYLFGPVKDKKK